MLTHTIPYLVVEVTYKLTRQTLPLSIAHSIKFLESQFLLKKGNQKRVFFLKLGACHSHELIERTREGKESV